MAQCVFATPERKFNVFTYQDEVLEVGEVMVIGSKVYRILAINITDIKCPIYAVELLANKHHVGTLSAW